MSEEQNSEMGRRQAFIKALVQFQSMVPCIGKNQQAGKGGFAYKYAGLDSIHDAIQGPLKECGLAVFFSTESCESGFVVSCEVMHIEGYSKASKFEVAIDPQARMNLAQKAGSALTYGRRYALCAALGLVTADEDDDAQSMGREPQRQHRDTGPAWDSMPPDYQAPPAPGKISEKQKRRLEARIKESESDREALKAYIKRQWDVDHFQDLDREQYDVIDGMIDRKMQQA